MNNDNTKHIKIEKIDTNKFKITSNIYQNDEGIYENSFLCLNKLGKGKVYYNHINFDDNIWYKNQ